MSAPPRNPDILAELSELERRVDGATAPADRRAPRLGGPAALARAGTEARTRCADRLARDAVAGIAAARAETHAKADLGRRTRELASLRHRAVALGAWHGI